MSQRSQRDLILNARKQVEAAKQDSLRHSRTIAGSEQSSRPPRPSASRLSLVSYEVHEEIHRGGQGVVYRGVHRGTGRVVAVKVQHGGGFLGEVEHARFEREVQILARLSHPNIVTIHDMGQGDAGAYHVMDYVDGLPLDRYAASNSLGPLDTMRLMEKVAGAVSAAHVRGVLHRDLKPGNILVDRAGEPHILDFGLAKGPDFDFSLTETGQFVGSLPWASPEQISGNSGAIDVRTDVYSLGVILHRMLTGSFPYDVSGSAHQVMSNIQHAAPAPPGVSDEIDTIVLRCLRKEPERRYQSAGEFAADIRRFLAGEPIDAKRDSTWYVVRKQIQRHRVAAFFVAVLLLTLVASSLVAWILYARAEREAVRSSLAESVARRRLRDSMVSESRALRLSNEEGRRHHSLALLNQAMGESDAAPGSGDALRMRSEAWAAMSLSDAELVFVWPKEPGMLAQTFSHDGKLRAAGFDDGRVRLFTVASGELLAQLAFPDAAQPLGADAERSVYMLRFSSSGKYLGIRYGGSGPLRLSVWDLESRTMLVDVARENRPREFDFAPDDSWFMFGVADGLEVLSLPDGERRLRVPMPVAPRLLAVDRTSGRAAVVSDAPEIRLLDPGTGAILSTLALDEADVPGAVAFSGDGSWIAAGLESGEIRIWDAPTGAVRHKLSGHFGTVIGLDSSNDGAVIVSWSWDNTTRLWDAATGRMILEPFAGYSAVRLGAKGRVASLHTVGALRNYAASTEYLRLTPPGSSTWRGSMSLSPDQRTLILDEGPMKPALLIDLESGARRSDIVHRTWTRWTADGVVGVTARGIERWNSIDDASGRLLLSLPGIKRFQLLPGGKRGVVHDARDRIVIVHLDSSQDELVLSEKLANCTGLKFSPDGKWICADLWRGKSLTVWNSETGAVVAELPQSPAGHARSWFGADGRWLMTSSGPEFVCVSTLDWKVKRRIEREDSQERIGGLAAFSADRSMAAMTTNRTNIQVIDARTFVPLANVVTPDAGMKTLLMFSADGRWLLACDSRGALHAWDLTQIRRRLGTMRLDWE